tara:strand:- start:4 stop:510 length:507 start_codon:yes stop_codon:yes gene_type:complete
MGKLKEWVRQDWVRIGTDGKIKGKCGTSKNKKNPDRCLPRAKAERLSKRALAKTARKKKREGSLGKQFVKNTKEVSPKLIRRTTGKGGNYRKTKDGAGMTKKGVAAYNRKTGGNLKTAVTGKVKPGSKAAKRRKSYCARSLGQLKRSSAKTRNNPNSRIRQARRRWKC